MNTAAWELIEALSRMSRSDEVPAEDLEDERKALDWAIGEARSILNAAITPLDPDGPHYTGSGCFDWSSQAR